MGSPVSAVIADLVTSNTEERALSTCKVVRRWWQRYVDDSNVCLKKTDAELFDQHLNSIDVNIQFTIERACHTEKPFLDSQVTVLSDVHRTAAHTNKYLDFASHNPMQHKVAVVTTLLNTADHLPSHPELRPNEWERVLAADLRTFAPIATAHPYSVRKFTCHVMHRARAKY